MKAFGLELRRTAGISALSLYKDVDRVLRKSGVQEEHVGAAMQQQTVAHALQKMMTPGEGYSSGYLSVCVIKECAQLCGIVIPAERMRVYNPLHCMRWNEMLPDFRATICAMILDDFRSVLTANTDTPQNP
jgi:hypothetical protein